MKRTLSKNETELYTKQIKLTKIGIEGQERIKRKKVLVIGAGGLGCPILIYLVASGIGNIGILDNDRIESSNLNRQILYRSNNINNYKVETALKNLKNINKECHIAKHNYQLDIENSIETISYYDIVIDATDNFFTRHLIDKTCYRLNKIYIYGAVSDFEGQVGVFNYQSGIRYNNLYYLKSEAENNTCNTRGIIGITTGYIGILQAIETIKTTLGLDRQSHDQLHIYNIVNRITKNKYIKLTRNSIKKTIKKEDAENIDQQQQLSIKKYCVTIDVKNKEEFAVQHISKSINIPLSMLRFHKAIKLLKKYNTHYNFKIYCSSKSKSTIASKILNRNVLEYEVT